jgi:hypothetical protein
MLVCEVGMVQGHLNSLVPHEFLDRADVNTRHNEMAGKRMPQIMPAKVDDPCLRKHQFKPTPPTI